MEQKLREGKLIPREESTHIDNESIPQNICADDDLSVCDEDKSAENYQSELLKLVNEVSSPWRKDDWVVVVYEISGFLV